MNKINKSLKPTIRNISTPPENFYLPENQVDIWLIDIDSFHKLSETRSSQNILSPDEMKTANRLVVPEKRNQYTSSCSVPRRILSNYLSAAPGALDFKYSPSGKPSLSGEQSGRLSFNISHSNGKMLLGLTAADEIGIDIEKVNNSRLINKIASRKFTQLEINLLNKCDKEESAQRFCRLWTRKEAALKAAGTGLLFPMRNVDVSDVKTGRSVFIGQIPQKFEIITRSDWYFYDIESFDGFCAAVSMNFIPESINIFRISSDYFFQDSK